MKSAKSIRPRPGNLAVQTAVRLRTAILAGEHAIGQPLRELELCAKYGVSRAPLREALRTLEGEGLVVLRPNRGAVVAELSPAEVQQIAEVCRLLEGHLLKKAVPGLTPEILDQAEACLEELDRIPDPREWARVNWRFHTTLYSGAARPLIEDLLTSLRERAELAMLILVADPNRRAVLNREHRAILDCVRSGRATEAAKLLDDHLLGGKDEVLRLIETRSRA